MSLSAHDEHERAVRKALAAFEAAVDAAIAAAKEGKVYAGDITCVLMDRATSSIGGNRYFGKKK